MTHLPLPQVEHELKLGLKSKIEETEAMWHLLNTMFKNVEREFRYVDAILKSLEANGEQGEKQGLGAVTAACLELKMRKVRVHKAFEVEASISAEEASRDDGVLILLHGETDEQLKMRALLKANLVQARYLVITPALASRDEGAAQGQPRAGAAVLAMAMLAIAILNLANRVLLPSPQVLIPQVLLPLPQPQPQPQA